MYCVAMRHASIAHSKASAGLRAAITGMRRIAIAAIDRLVEVALLGLGRQAGGRAAALRIDDDQRQLGHDRQAHRLGLQRDAGAGRDGDAQLAGIARADRGADRGDLVFRLEGGDAEFLQPRQVVQDRARPG